MAWREWADRNPLLAVGLAIAILTVALAVVGARLWDPTPRPQAQPLYYWDLEAERVFVARTAHAPTVQAPSGGQGVRVHLYTCGECIPGQWFGYLERPNPGGAGMTHGHQVRDLAGGPWHHEQDARALELYESLDTRCGNGSAPIACHPPDKD